MVMLHRPSPTRWHWDVGKWEDRWTDRKRNGLRKKLQPRRETRLPILQAHVETNLDPIPASLIFVRKRENKCLRFRSNDECR